MKKIILYAKREFFLVLFCLIAQELVLILFFKSDIFTPLLFLIIEEIIWAGIICLIFLVSRKFETIDYKMAKLLKRVFKYGLLILIIGIPWMFYILQKLHGG